MSFRISNELGMRLCVFFSAEAKLSVIPTQVGIHLSAVRVIAGWIPAFAGMTSRAL
jgi:hypothetical protein